jgi:hypothetical protein
MTGIHKDIYDRLEAVRDREGEWFDSLLIIATYSEGGRTFKQVMGAGNDYARRESAREWLKDRAIENFEMEEMMWEEMMDDDDDEEEEKQWTT